MRRMKNIAVAAVAVSLAAAVVLQLVFGHFPVDFLAFPVNLALALLWIFLLWYPVRASVCPAFVQAMLSPAMTWTTLSLTAAGMLAVGLFRQMNPADALAQPGVAGRLGLYDFTGTWIFAVIQFWLLSHLGMVTVRGFLQRRRRRVRFLLNHFGLWLALFAGFAGKADEQVLRIPAWPDRPAEAAYDAEGRRVFLGKELMLKDFRMDTYADGSPRHYRATVLCDGQELRLEVNRPRRTGFGERLYLAGYDTRGPEPEYAVLQLVRQPYAGVMLAGILMMLCGAFLLFAGGASDARQERPGTPVRKPQRHGRDADNAGCGTDRTGCKTDKTECV